MYISFMWGSSKMGNFFRVGLDSLVYTMEK